MKKTRRIFLITYFLLIVIGTVTRIGINSIPKVKTVSIQKQDIVNSISAVGTITVKEYGIFPAFSSQIKNVYVKEGDKVEENDVLAWVKSDTSTPVIAGIENYKNNLYNQYAAALSQLVSNSEIEKLYGNLNIMLLDEYTSVVQDTTRLHSPVKGIVSKVNVQTGENSGIALPTFIVSDYNDVYVTVKIPENKINKVKIGQSVKITGSGLKRKYIGTVASIATKANHVALTGSESTVDVKISLTDPDENIVSGFSANCVIETSKEKNASVLPAACILQDESGKEFVYVCNNNLVEKKYVNCTYFSSQKVKISGLNENDLVIIGSNDLKENCKVIVQND